MTEMLTRVAAVTVSVVEPEMVPSVAVMSVEPCACVVASPVTVLMVATLVVPEVQVAWMVMFWTGTVDLGGAGP